MLTVGAIANALSGGAPVLMLHRVLEQYDPNNYYYQRGTAISWQRFNTCLLWAVECREQGLPGPVFSFDDGYADNEPAIKALLSAGLPVVLFPVRDFVLTGFSPIDDMAARLNQGELELSAKLRASLIGGKLKACLAKLNADQYRAYRQRWFAIDEDASSAAFLSELQLRELVSMGLQLGVHGVSHRIWTEISPADLHAEIQGSLEWLSSLGCKHPFGLCMPHGKINVDVYQALSAYSLPLFGVDQDYPFAVLRRRWLKEQTEL